MNSIMSHKTDLTNQEIYQQRVFDEKADNYDSQGITFGGCLVLMEPNWIYPTNIGFMIFLKEDRHMFIMRQNKILKWMADAKLEQCKVENLL
jgi:hypothetical protein